MMTAKRHIIRVLAALTLSVGLSAATSVTAVAQGASTGVHENTAAPVEAQATVPANAISEPSPQASPRDNNALWEAANTAYYAGDFASAAALYTTIEQSGMVSAKLYYNKAGALFKMGKIGESILYYSKAQRLAPGDGDITHNLAIASSYTRNRIDPIPEFFLARWMRSVGAIMSGNAWAGLSIVLLAAMLVGALLYFLPLGSRTRKMGFYGGLGALLLLIFAFSFANRDWHETVRPTGGIVTSPSAAVKSSPDSAGKDLFLLYEGDRVRLLDAMGEWSEISVANGNRGWIRSGAVSVID